MKRLSALRALITAASMGLHGDAFTAFMAGVRIKKSGKGKGVPGRIVNRCSNKFKPGQSGTGARECARRARQRAAA